MVVLKMAKRWTENLDKFQKSINLDKSRKIWICGSIAILKSGKNNIPDNQERIGALSLYVKSNKESRKGIWREKRNI